MKSIANALKLSLKHASFAYFINDYKHFHIFLDYSLIA